MWCNANRSYCRICKCGENEGSEKAQKMLSCKSCGKLKKNILYTPGKLEKMLDVKCLIEKEHFILARNPLGKLSHSCCVMLSCFCNLPWYLHKDVQGAAACSLYGILLHLSESIIKLSIEWNLSGIMNMVVVAQRSWSLPSLISLMVDT